MAFINSPFNLAGGENKVIPLDRHGYPAYTLIIDSGAGTALLEGTLQRVNRGETPSWSTMSDQQGMEITVAAAGITNPEDTPVEAVRITATGAIAGRFMQTGAE